MTTTFVPHDQQMPTGPWTFAAVVEAGMFLAETRTELIAALMGPDAGYLEMDADVDNGDRLVARWESLAEAARRAQEAIVSQGAREFDEIPEDVLTTLLTPVAAGAQPKAIGLAWTDELPLLVLATDYVPYTEHAQPTGDNVWFLDPATETTFLAALDRLGAIQMRTRLEGDDA